MKKITLTLTFVSLLAATSSIHAASYYCGFEDATARISSYVGGTTVDSNIVWTFSSAVHGSLTSDPKEGGWSVRLGRNVGVAEASIESQVITGGFSYLSFKYALYSTITPSITLAAEISTDYGVSWTTLGNVTAQNSTLADFSTTFSAQDVKVRFITVSGGTGSRARMNIDTLALIPEPSMLVGLLAGLGGLLVLVRRHM